MNVNVYNLYSGSEGNATYIGTDDEGFLIDCGKSIGDVIDELSKLGINPEKIKAIFITHSHTDHTSAVHAFSQAFGIPVLSNVETLKAITEKKILDPRKSNLFICEEENVSDNFVLTPFEVLHDVPNQGIVITMPNGVKVGYATDIAKIDNDIFENFLDCEIVFIESNYDPDMLAASDRSEELKDRIRADDTGHITNEMCANLCAQLAYNKTKHFILGHLSRECNTEELCRETFTRIMNDNGFYEGVDYTLDIANQYSPTVANTKDIYPLKETEDNKIV